MNDDNLGIIVGVLLVMGLSGMLGFTVGLAIGVNVGRIEVASEQVHCRLNTNKDQTTEWGCYEVKR